MVSNEENKTLKKLLHAVIPLPVGSAAKVYKGMGEEGEEGEGGERNEVKGEVVHTRLQL